MAHVELSLSQPGGLAVDFADGFGSPLARWASAVATAQEPCLLLDDQGAVVAASPGCAQLLAIDPAEASGRRLVDGVIRVLDFNAVCGELPDWEVEKIPPLLPLNTGSLARGLLRVAGADGVANTLDAIATPVRDRAVVVGSLTFFASVGLA